MAVFFVISSNVRTIFSCGFTKWTKRTTFNICNLNAINFLSPLIFVDCSTFSILNVVHHFTCWLLFYCLLSGSIKLMIRLLVAKMCNFSLCYYFNNGQRRIQNNSAINQIKVIFFFQLIVTAQNPCELVVYFRVIFGF